MQDTGNITAYAFVFGTERILLQFLDTHYSEIFLYHITLIVLSK